MALLSLANLSTGELLSLSWCERAVLETYRSTLSMRLLRRFTFTGAAASARHLSCK